MRQAIEIPPPSKTGQNNQNVAHSLVAQVIEARKVRLHGLSTRQIAPDKYIIGRAGGRGAIITGTLGVAAIDLLDKGSSPREVEALLSRRTNTSVEICVLLSSLLRAGFITTADSTRFATSRVGAWTQLHAKLRARLNPTALTDFLAASVPPALGLRILGEVRYRALSASSAFSANELTRRISASGFPISPGMCRRHQRELASQDSLTRIIIQAQPARLDSWIRSNVTLVGRRHLIDSLDGGRGTIVAAFHYGAFPLLPVCLAANGFPISMPHFGVQFGALPHERVFDSHVRACGWAPVVVHRKGSLATIAQLIRTLKAGGIAVISADYCSPHARDDSPDAKDRSARQTRITVGIGDRRMMVENLVGWLAAMTGASVLPSVSYRKRRGKYAVELRPALEFTKPDNLSSRDCASTITRSVFASLERDVVADPLKWAFLGSFTEAGAAR